jgi:hypothetical protein
MDASDLPALRGQVAEQGRKAFGGGGAMRAWLVRQAAGMSLR